MKKNAIAIIVIILVAGSAVGGYFLFYDPVVPEDEPNIAYYANDTEPILNWDPAICFSNGIIVLNNVYETLLKFIPSTEEFENVLATDYAVSDDDMSWNFTLRENVTFHDGTAFNASSVKYSIDRTLFMDQGAAFIWYAVENITVISEFVVQFNLYYPSPINLVAASAYGAFIYSEAAIESNVAGWLEDGNEAGTGPYTLESQVAGDEVILAKYDDYWGGWDDTLDQFDKVVIKKHSETSVRRSMVENGDADITTNLPPVDIDALKAVTDVEVSDNPSFTNMFAHFNTEKAPLNDSRVRRALSYAFPYEDVISTAAGGYAEQSTGVIPSGLWGHSDDLFQYELNTTEAEALFAEAGVDPETLELELTYTSGDEAQRITAELYQAKLAEIGVTLTITGLPWTSQWEQAKNEDPEDRQDIFMLYWWPDISSPMSWLFSQYVSEEYILFNLAYYNNTDAEDLIFWADSVTGSNQTLAEELFIEAQEIIIEDAPSIFIYDRRDVFILSTDFEGFVYNPSYPNTVFFYECYRAE
jgi:peptide/nickel transport system substrate-binding protein